MEHALWTWWLLVAALLSDAEEAPDIGGTQPPSGPPR